MPHLDNETLLLAFVAVTGLAVLLQAIILLAIFITVRKTAITLRNEAEDLRSSVLPIIYNTREMMTRLAPKIETAVDDLAEIARGLKVQTAEVQSSANEILERLRRQTAHLDAICTGVLDGVDRVGGFVTDVVRKPVIQASSVLASIRAMVEALRKPVAEPRQSHTSWDKDMFV